MELLILLLCRRGVLVQTRSRIGLRDGFRQGPELLRPPTLGGHGGHRALVCSIQGITLGRPLDGLVCPSLTKRGPLGRHLGVLHGRG